MKKIFSSALATCMVAGLLLGTAASADPGQAATDSATQAELALLGPDRSPRAPQRAVKAPVQRTETRRELPVEPPAPPVKPFVYEKRNCQSLLNVPYDLQGEDFFCYNDGAIFHYFDEGKVVMWTPEGRFPVNKLGAMGADREFMRLEYGERMGVWANGRIADQEPTEIVSDMVARIKGLTCGTWTAPKATYVAGVPVVQATGVDEYANFYYEVTAWERFGNKYAIATRVPYRSRYNTARNTELAWIVSHFHATNWTE